MKGNLYLATVLIFCSTAFLFLYWDDMLFSFNCQEGMCTYTKSDLLKTNITENKFNIKDITSIQKKYCKEKTRKGRTYTYSLYYVETKSQNFYINKKAYNYLLKYSKKNIKDFNYTEYEFYGLIFIFILFFIGIINIYFHFKPFNLNIIDDKMIKTIERDGIIGLFQK